MIRGSLCALCISAIWHPISNHEPPHAKESSIPVEPWIGLFRQGWAKKSTTQTFAT